MKTSQKNHPRSFSFDNRVASIIIFLILLPGLGPSAILFYFSGLMIYQKIYLWLKFDTNIDVSIYNCLISNSNYCNDILSNFPFEYIPQNFVSWLYHPTDWLGLHTIIKPILEFVPLWIAGFVCAFFIFFTWLLIVVGFFQLFIIVFKKIKSFMIRFFK